VQIVDNQLLSGIINKPIYVRIIIFMPTQEFNVGGFRVDMGRSQIIAQDAIVAMEPKVLHVLLILAENQGSVVTHQTLLERVWPNVEVAPNALQRCIAHLRKALNDDSKSQSVIATHPKVGYSLIADVDWMTEQVSTQIEEINRQQVEFASEHRNESEHPIGQESAAHSPTQAKLLSDTFKQYLPTNMTTWILITAILGLLTATTLLIRPNADMPYHQIQPLTASDDKEFYPNYSPDGRYMVFHRYIDLCENHVWAKDLHTQKETRLTSEAGVYGEHSWSKDGTQIAFTRIKNCKSTATDVNVCWELRTLDFAMALQTPQLTAERFGCSDEIIETPKWLADGSFLWLMKQESRYVLMKYDQRTGALTPFYQSKTSEIYFFDYEPNQQIIAVVGRANKGNHELQILDISGNIQSRSMITKTEDMSYFQHFEAVFHSSGEYLITDSILGLYRLDFDGSLSAISTPNTHEIYSPRFHPTTNAIVAAHGIMDTDIALLNRSALKHAIQDTKEEVNEQNIVVGFNQVQLPYASLSRSKQQELAAKFQPNGNGIAFISNRSGKRQIWYHDGEEAIQLSHFAPNYYTRSYAWAGDGSRIAVANRDQVSLFSLTGDEEIISSDAPIREVLQWLDSDQLLIISAAGNETKLGLLSIETGQVIYLPVSSVSWARMANQQLFYIDKMGLGWRKKKDEPAIALKLDGLAGKNFEIWNNKLYGIHPQTNQLWSYGIDNHQIDIITQLKEKAWILSDINDTQLLLTQIITARKEIVEIQ
jgi:transcriptional activator of cad operon